MHNEINIKRLELTKMRVAAAKASLELDLMELEEKINKTKNNIEIQDKELVSLDEKIIKLQGE